MYYYLLSALKRRIILELQDSFSRHPVYEKAVPWIQNKFSFDERPQFGIVVKSSNSNKVQFSADNYIGTIVSKVMLAYVDQPDHLLEWAKEDLATLRANGDVMPIQSGVYILECVTVPTDPGEQGTYLIHPKLTVTNETLLISSTGIEQEAQLLNVPIAGTLRLWENNRVLLVEGRDYSVDEKGLVTFLGRLLRGSTVVADYRYVTPTLGPFNWSWNSADYEHLPGVVLAFGKRGRAGDKVAVVISDDRVDVARAFGGKFELSFDLDVIARDPIQMEEMADFAVMSLWGVKRNTLSHEGIEIVDVSVGGESEESYDETGDLYYYMASLSLQVQADWEVHVPLPLVISRVSPTDAQVEAQIQADLTAPSEGTLRAVHQPLLYQTVPIIVGRNAEYERIT